MAVCPKWFECKLHNRLLKGCYQRYRTISSSNVSFAVHGEPERKYKKYTNTVALPRTEFPLRLDSQKRIDRDNYLHEVLKVF
jgi:hypothetical protein